MFALACSVRKNENSDVAISMNYDFTSFFSWSNSICNPEMAIMRDSRPSKTIATFYLLKVDTLSGHSQVGRHLSPPKANP